MDGLTRSEIDRTERADIAPGPKRPRDAATLILLDRRGSDILVLMGRRHARHVFMPGKLVFPGGRTDPADSRIPVAAPLAAEEEAKLMDRMVRAGRARVRAIALSAVREAYEEAGVLIGRAGTFATNRPEWRGFAEHGVEPSLDRLRFVARAITPPGRVRRFDTRFLAAWRSDAAAELPGGGITDELEEMGWLPIGEAANGNVAPITGTILRELGQRLADDPLLRPGGRVPFYRMLNGRMVRQIL